MSRGVKPAAPEVMRLRLYTPHEGQRELHASRARFRVAVCGRRWGKTFAGANEVVKYSWEHPDNPSWWVAPTYNQAKKVFRLCTRYFATAVASHKSAVGEMEIVWKSGGRTEFKSAERYDNLRGEGVGFMVLDEFCQMPRAAWEYVLRATLSDTLGRALFIGTPRGKNWGYALYQRGLSERPQDADWESFSFPTASSPYIAQSEIDDAEAILPVDVFNQEYCHLGSTLVARAGGESARFDGLRVGDELLYCEGGEVRACSVTKFRSTGSKQIVTVTSEAGTKFSASLGHKVRARSGKVAVESATEMHYVPVPRYSHEPQEALARLLGYGIGDGSICLRQARYTKTNGEVSLYAEHPQASFYAKHRRDLEAVARDMVIAGLKESVPSVLVKKGNQRVADTCQVHVSHAAAQGLIDAGFPVGNRTLQEFSVPPWVTAGTPAVQREFLAGLWGAEGSTPRAETKFGKSAGSFCLSMVKGRGSDGEGFFGQLSEMMGGLGVKTTVTRSISRKGATTLHLYVAPGRDNTIAFLEEVGYRYAAAKEHTAFEWLLYLRAGGYAAVSRTSKARDLRSGGESYASIGRSIGCCAQQALNIVRDGTDGPGWRFPPFTEWIAGRRGDGGVYLAVTDTCAVEPAEVFNITVDSPDHSYLLADGLDNFNCADFLDEAAGVFHGVEGCIHGELQPEREMTGTHNYVIGVDWAKHTDFTVITVLDTDAVWEKRVVPHVVRMERMNVLNYVSQMDRVEEIARIYAPRAILVDSTGIGEPLHDGLAMRGLPVYPYHLSGMRKTQLIQGLSVAIQSKGVSYPDLPLLLGELSAYQYTMSPTGAVVYQAPEGDHDDTVISLALAVWAAQHPIWTPETRFVVEDGDDWSISPI